MPTRVAVVTGAGRLGVHGRRGVTVADHAVWANGTDRDGGRELLIERHQT